MIVPYVKQEDDYTCGLAAVMMILLYWKREVPSRETLIDLMRVTPRYGTNRTNMIRAMRHFGFHVDARCYTCISEVRRAVYAGMPVIINYRETKDNIGHYGVVVGMEGQTIVLHDPWHGPEQRMTLARFKSRWYGEYNSRYLNWALFAWPKTAKH